MRSRTCGRPTGPPGSGSGVDRTGPLCNRLHRLSTQDFRPALANLGEAPMATIRDVAQAAGVSVATVSRVLNRSERVADDTRARVERVMAKLEYWPHGAAQSLNTSRTHTLGVLLPDLHGQFFSEVIRGVDQGAREHGFQILVSSSHADVETLMTGARAMAGRVDGLI